MKSVDLAFGLALSVVGLIAKAIGEDPDKAREELQKRQTIDNDAPEKLETEIKAELP